MDPTRAELIQIFEAYAKAMGLSQSYVSQTFYGRWNWLEEFKANSEATITVRKQAKLLEQFAKCWPAGVKWPGRTLKRPRLLS